LVPSLPYWRTFKVEMTKIEIAYKVLEMLSTFPCAPLLEDLDIRADCGLLRNCPAGGYAPFSANLPKMSSLSVLNVPLNWKKKALFKNLQALVLEYEADMEDFFDAEVMPTYARMHAALRDADKLSSLRLSGFVPRIPINFTRVTRERILRLPNLRTLTLSFISPEDVADLAPYLPLENLSHLTLNLRSQSIGAGWDYTAFMQILFPDPIIGLPEPWHKLSQLTYLDLLGLKCEEHELILMFDALTGLTHLEISMTKAIRQLPIPCNFIEGGGENGKTLPIFAVPKLRYLRVFGGDSLRDSCDGEFDGVFAELMESRIKNGCRKLLQLIAPEWLVIRLRARGGTDKYTKYLDANEDTVRFRDEYGLEDDQIDEHDVR
jgi:hypothetical protein